MVRSVSYYICRTERQNSIRAVRAVQPPGAGGSRRRCGGPGPNLVEAVQGPTILWRYPCRKSLQGQAWAIAREAKRAGTLAPSVSALSSRRWYEMLLPVPCSSHPDPLLASDAAAVANQHPAASASAPRNGRLSSTATSGHEKAPPEPRAQPLGSHLESARWRADRVQNGGRRLWLVLVALRLALPVLSSYC